MSPPAASLLHPTPLSPPHIQRQPRPPLSPVRRLAPHPLASTRAAPSPPPLEARRALSPPHSVYKIALGRPMHLPPPMAAPPKLPAAFLHLPRYSDLRPWRCSSTSFVVPFLQRRSPQLVGLGPEAHPIPSRVLPRRPGKDPAHSCGRSVSLLILRPHASDLSRSSLRGFGPAVAARVLGGCPDF
jgi:hypothetical protein